MNQALLYLQSSDSVKKIFGDGVTDVPFSEGTVSDNFSTVFGFAINVVFAVAGITALIYMMWGAFDYITSGGDQEKIQNSRDKMVRAFFGMIVLVAVLVIWLFISRDILGIVGGEGSVIEFDFPRIGPTEAPVPGQGPGGPAGDQQPTPI